MTPTDRTDVVAPGGSSGLRPAPQEEVGRGTLLGLAAYGLWGLFPLYFDALKPAGPWEILSHRILWTLLVCLVVLLVLRDLGWVPPLLHRPRLLAGTAVAAVLIAVNWVVYVAAVTSGNTSAASLSSCSGSASVASSGSPSASVSSRASSSPSAGAACRGSR